MSVHWSVALWCWVLFCLGGKVNSPYCHCTAHTPAVHVGCLSLSVSVCCTFVTRIGRFGTCFFLSGLLCPHTFPCLFTIIFTVAIYVNFTACIFQFKCEHTWKQHLRVPAFTVLSNFLAPKICFQVLLTISPDCHISTQVIITVSSTQNFFIIVHETTFW